MPRSKHRVASSSFDSRAQLVPGVGEGGVRFSSKAELNFQAGHRFAISFILAHLQ